jgi:hypothetical protein
MYYNCGFVIIKILIIFKINVYIGLSFFFSLMSGWHECTNWIVIIVEIEQVPLFQILFLSFLMEVLSKHINK